ERRTAAKFKAEADSYQKKTAHEKLELDRLNMMAATDLKLARITDQMQVSQEQYLRVFKERLEFIEAAHRYESNLKEKNLRAALRFWEKLSPDPAPPYPDQAAEYWLERRDYGRTLAEYRKAIEIQPENANLYNLYAWLLATCPDSRFRDGKQAVESATRACE